MEDSNIFTIEYKNFEDFLKENRKDLFKEATTFEEKRNIFNLLRKKFFLSQFNLTEIEKSIIKRLFLDKNGIITEDTLKFLKDDKDCILSSLKNKIEVVEMDDFFIGEDLIDTAVEEAIRQRYIINSKSPVYLCKNYVIAKNSLDNDINTADFVDWESLLEEEQNSLLEMLNGSGYTLSDDSPEYLKNNETIIWISLKNDPNSIFNASGDFYENREILTYCIKQGVKFYSTFFKGINAEILSVKHDSVILDAFLKTITEDEELIGVIKDIFNGSPLIEEFQLCYDELLNQRWKSLKREHSDLYQNIFGKICSQLQGDYASFEEAINDMTAINKIKEVLNEKYSYMHCAMKKYYEIINGNAPDKMTKIQPYQEIISNFSAHYIAICKEDFKKQEMEKFNLCLKQYYSIKKDSPTYRNAVFNIQKFIFYSQYLEKDPVVLEFIDSLANKYKNEFNVDTVKQIIYHVISKYYIDQTKFFEKPRRFDEYVEYEKISKLINRLNKGYISIDGIEVRKYIQHISLDNEIGKYIYNGRNFTEAELQAMEEYKKKSYIFKKIKNKIMLKISEIELTEENKKLVDETALLHETIFDDKNYEFSIEKIFSECDSYYIKSIIEWMDENGMFENLQSYKELKKYFNTHMFFWMGILLDLFSDKEVYIDDDFANDWFIREFGSSIIKNFDKIVDFSIKRKLPIKTLRDLKNINTLIVTDDRGQKILGEEIIHKLAFNKKYIVESDEKILSNAVDLVSQMFSRDKSTVPYVNGKYKNYRYSIYDTKENDILISGIDTDSCFRICGADNDFLHYCCLDKNGFAIKITDDLGNFIGRAAGFRNGNCVFINQLRTLNDVGGDDYNGQANEEISDIINTFYEACRNIVESSSKNEAEEIKIDYVFVNCSYILKDEDVNVDDIVLRAIKDYPMDNKSEDWQLFKENTKNLDESSYSSQFNNDYGNYPVICVASSKELSLRELNFKDVPALYERKRNNIIIAKNPEYDLIQKMNRIKAIDAWREENVNFNEVEIGNKSTAFIGDDWYIVLEENEIKEQCIFTDFDKAVREYESTIEVIHEFINSKENNLINDFEKQIVKKLNR